ncbi:dihydroorotase [Chitinophaga skermanii]|uniref:Dihydroorotase n=1 Tax=Chitinophaga skermanii TaxID=331697 RepID=A0A327QMT1_9BACT|nr:dihydroorotase [Chitinophaga skermanii]RAJ05348.1 dihydroorotase [Chitinophaga skermanii]
MQILLKSATIISANSSFNGQTKDILISNGTIQQIGDQLSADGATVVDAKGLHVSAGWVDVFSHFNDPGTEYKEDLQSGSLAAAKGGYTTVMIVPNTQPGITSKPQVEYVLSKTRHGVVNVLPMGAVSKNLEGSNLAEMYEMQQTGAVAFTDGLKPIQSPGIMLKALQYVKAFDGVIVQIPEDTSISGHGLMNEGVQSTLLGMPGKPAIAEEMMIKRDLELADYTNSRIHFTGVSTANSIALIAAAKAKGIQVTCSVTPYHLCLNDESLRQYNTNLKVNPPLRTAADVAALQAAVADGTVDCFATHHLPQDWDAKEVEFEYAKGGMIGLESAFGVIRKALPNVPVEKIVHMLTVAPREIFGLPAVNIEEGAKANLTFFLPNEPYTFTKEHIGSLSKNSYFIGDTLVGKVLGICNNQQISRN